MLLLLILCCFQQILLGSPLPSPLGHGSEITANATGLVAANFTSILTANTTGVLPAESPANDAGRQMRSAWDIIQSCLFTIIACVWTSIHPNINGPRDSWWTCMKRRVVITFYAVIAPEVVLLWALKQRIAAKQIAERYNEKLPRPVKPKMTILQKIKSFFCDIHALFQRLPEETTWRGDGQLWTTTHGFFVEMGGFMLYDKGYPNKVLTYDQLEELLQIGAIDAPTVTERELQDKSKGDTISKGLVVLQTSWFVLQCIVRGIQHLPLSELEVVTLAFAVMNGAIYAAWWGKPQGVDTAIPIPLRQVGNGSNSPPSTLRQTDDKHSNNQSEKQSLKRLDEHTEELSWVRRTLRQDRNEKTLPVFVLICVPFRVLVCLVRPLVKIFRPREAIHKESLRVQSFGTTYSSRSGLDLPEGISFTIGLVFGAIHLLGWTIEFPSPLDHILWQISAVVLTVAPFVLLIAGLLTVGKQVKQSKVANFVKIICLGVFFISIPFYIIARFVVIAIAVKAIVHPPQKVLFDTSWTRLIPHF